MKVLPVLSILFLFVAIAMRHISVRMHGEIGQEHRQHHSQLQQRKQEQPELTHEMYWDQYKKESDSLLRSKTQLMDNLHFGMKYPIALGLITGVFALFRRPFNFFPRFGFAMLFIALFCFSVLLYKTQV